MLKYPHFQAFIIFFIVSTTISDPIVSRHLKINENLSISWLIEGEPTLTFNVTANKISPGNYVSIGISYNGAMNGADIGIAKIFPNGSVVFEDRYGIGNTSPVLDPYQDWTLLSSTVQDNKVAFIVSRPLQTGDVEHDIDITEDTLRLIWATGPFEIDNGRLHYHESESRGSVSVNFMDPDMDTPSHEELSKTYQLWQPKRTTQVPMNETTYICSFFKSPVNTRHHIVGFGIHSNPVEAIRHIHHIDMYRCVAPTGASPREFFEPFVGNDYDCNYSPIPFPYENCLNFEFTWSEGGVITLFPDNLGLPLNPNEYYMTEVHYDNPELRSDLKIESGFNIYHNEKVRETEIGQLTIGFDTSKTYALTIPPNSTDFVVSSHCSGECMNGLPKDGLNIFTCMLHSHMSGRRLILRQFRDGVELPPIARDDHYDYNYQNNRRLRNPLKILPNDHLTVECVYDTMWKKGQSVLGGRSARHEMCLAFLLYWPRIENINTCGSYHSQEEILNVMGVDSVSQYQGEVDATVISPSNLAGLKYSNVVESRMNWTTSLRVKYQKMVQFGEQETYCMPTVSNNHTFAKTMYPNLSSGQSNSHTVVVTHIVLAFIARIVMY